ncbi:Rossmann-like alpha/beta/alpha sandwich fold protein [Raphanus sativus]|nr:Rossmann-like alpha/beta/alpha sandwich fold protein [Raphanus sativus]
MNQLGYIKSTVWFDQLEKQEPESSSSEKAQAVTPWVVSGNVDHEKVIEKFGSDRIDESLIARVERLTSRRAHVFLRRGVFCTQRYLQEAFNVPLVIKITDDEKKIWKKLPKEECTCFCFHGCLHPDIIKPDNFLMGEEGLHLSAVQ